MNTPPNISDREWAQELSDTTFAPECDECGHSADCSVNGQLLCVKHAVELYYDELQLIINPAEIALGVRFDVITDADELELKGFTATWYYYGVHESIITMQNIADMRHEQELVDARGLPQSEPLSVCCGAKQIGDHDICPDCREHTEFVTEAGL